MDADAMDRIQKMVAIREVVIGNRLAEDIGLRACIIISDGANHILWVDRPSIELFGYELDEFTALKVDDIMPERYRGTHHTAMATAYETGSLRLKGRRLLGIGINKGGEEFPVMVAPALADHPDIGRVFATTLYDLTPLHLDWSALLSIENG